MTFHSFVFFIRKISRRFTQGGILNWFYISVMLCLAGGIIAVSISTLLFLLRTFNAVIFVSNEEIKSEIPSFNIAGFKILAPRFGIAISDTFTPKTQSPRSTQETPLSSLPLSTPVNPPFSELRLRILNGTGIPGLAGTWKKRFEDKGLSGVHVGNAEEWNREGIAIIYKPEKEIFLTIVREVFKQYGSIVTREQTDNTLADDMVITIGK